MTASIADIPSEIIEQILVELDPIDVSLFSQSARRYRDLVYHSPYSHLWRSLYLAQGFDDPRDCLTPLLEPIQPSNAEWQSSLQAITHARIIAQDPSRCEPVARERVLLTLLHLATHVPALTSDLDHGFSKNALWLAKTLSGSALLDDASWPRTPAERQLVAQLHTYFGLTPGDMQPAAKIASRGFVYDLRNHSAATDYGPFMKDGSGRVNWVHMQALHHCLSMHLVDVVERLSYKYMLYPLSLPYCQSIIPPELDLAAEQDWAGVEGMWHVAFCFMDHHELLIYNKLTVPFAMNMMWPPRLISRQAIGDAVVLDASAFGDDDFPEEFHALPVRFRIVATVPDPAHPKHPKIYFVGEGTHVAMKGHAELTPDGHVGWHYLSGDHGSFAYSCSAVQVGGVRSPYGVLGVWTTSAHDELDPVGPLWMHKVEENSDIEE